jgi:hypothetical protein
MTRATGRGTLWTNDCVGGCAQGTYHSRPVSIRASVVRHRRFTHLLLIYRQARHTVHDHRSLTRFSARIYNWYSQPGMASRSPAWAEENSKTWP